MRPFRSRIPPQLKRGKEREVAGPGKGLIYRSRFRSHFIPDSGICWDKERLSAGHLAELMPLYIVPILWVISGVPG